MTYPGPTPSSRHTYRFGNPHSGPRASCPICNVTLVRIEDLDPAKRNAGDEAAKGSNEGGTYRRG